MLTNINKAVKVHYIPIAITIIICGILSYQLRTVSDTVNTLVKSGIKETSNDTNSGISGKPYIPARKIVTYTLDGVSVTEFETAHGVTKCVMGKYKEQLQLSCTR